MYKRILQDYTDWFDVTQKSASKNLGKENITGFSLAPLRDKQENNYYHIFIDTQ